MSWAFLRGRQLSSGARIGLLSPDVQAGTGRLLGMCGGKRAPNNRVLGCVHPRFRLLPLK